MSSPLSPHLLTLTRLARVLERNTGDELSLPQFRTLGSLLTGDERASELASRLAVPKPTLTALIDSLVARGFVTREGVAGDRRVVRLSITPEGRAAHGRVEDNLAVTFQNLLDLCPDPAAVLAGLDALRHALDVRFAEMVANEASVVASTDG